MQEKYQIIPRRYRPQSFKEVAGHEAIVSTLKNSLALHKVAQCYLFCGTRGTGKTTLARLLAKALNCEKRNTDQEPCNLCSSCLEISGGRSLDVLEIDGASHRGIDDIRQINETIGYATSKQGRTKIYIIDEVHMLTKEAFNALLKTLEEPPQNTKFFFATTEAHKVPSTILSRCQRFDLRRLTTDVIKTKLAHIAQDLGIPSEESAFHQLSLLADGSLRDAESLLDQVICSGLSPLTAEVVRTTFGLPPRSCFLELDDAIHTGNLKDALMLGTLFYHKGHDLDDLIEMLMEHFRHHLAMKLDHQVEELLQDEAMAYKEKNALYTLDHCLLILDLLIQWEQNRDRAYFTKIHFELLITSLVRSKKGATVDQLVNYLKSMESTASKQSANPIQQTSENQMKVAEEQSDNIETSATSPTPPLPSFTADVGRYETLLRFTAVELEGIISG